MKSTRVREHRIKKEKKHVDTRTETRAQQQTKTTKRFPKHTNADFIRKDEITNLLDKRTNRQE
jgi:hypothetical protein